MKYLIVLITLLVTGCSAFHEKPLPPSQATDIRLQVVWVESEEEIPVYARVYRGDIAGYSVWVNRSGSRACTIYAYKPYNVDDFKNLNSLGHELLHCTDGHYHGRSRDKVGPEIMEDLGLK